MDAPAGPGPVGHGRVPGRGARAGHGPSDRIPELPAAGLAREPPAGTGRRARAPHEPAQRDHVRRGGRPDRDAGPPPHGSNAGGHRRRSAARADPDPVAGRLVRRPAHAPPRPGRLAAPAPRRLGGAGPERQRWRGSVAGRRRGTLRRRAGQPGAHGPARSRDRPLHPRGRARHLAAPIPRGALCAGRARDRRAALPGAADPGRDGGSPRLRPPGHVGGLLVRGPGPAVRRRARRAHDRPGRQGRRPGRPGGGAVRAARGAHPGRLPGDRGPAAAVRPADRHLARDDVLVRGLLHERRH